jgi:uncharacterized membrane protein
MRPDKSWHDVHEQRQSLGARMADGFAQVVGSWTFIIVQSIILAIWVVLNLIAFIEHWDPYPFILLNLVLSFQAAYASPIIMMSQNRQGERDRAQAQHDYETNLAAKEEIEMLMQNLSALESDKIDKLLEGMKMLIQQHANLNGREFAVPNGSEPATGAMSG